MQGENCNYSARDGQDYGHIRKAIRQFDMELSKKREKLIPYNSLPKLILPSAIQGLKCHEKNPGWFNSPGFLL